MFKNTFICENFNLYQFFEIFLKKHLTYAKYFNDNLSAENLVSFSRSIDRL